MPFCIPKPIVDKLISKITSGELNPDMLRAGSSDTRRTYLSEIMGEADAIKANAIIEQAMTFKNWQSAMVTAFNKILGRNPVALRDILTKVNKMTELLNPADEVAFYNDLVAKKLKFEVSLEEAKKISELGRTAKEMEANITERRQIGQPATESEMAYGRAVTEFSNYVNELKNPPETFKSVGKMVITPSKWGKFATTVASVAKSVKAAFDNSAIFRQGWKSLFSNPRIWAKNAIQSFRDIINVLGGKKVMDEVKADIISRPTFELMKREKLAVSTIEEAYPTSLPESIPLFGKIYKASETAFTAFIYRTRADIFDKLVDTAKKTGGDTMGLGRIVNSLTGRGNLGTFEPVANTVNSFFFSPRLAVSHIQVVLQALLKSDKISAFARKQAAFNLAKMVGGTATVLAIANVLQPGSVDADPRSADFGKIRIGDTRFDVSGGMASLFTLAARLATLSSKSSTTGQVTKLNSGEFGSQTGIDVLVSFAQNKLSPAASVVKDILLGKDFQGNVPTVGGELNNLLTPLPLTTYIELKQNPNSANIILSEIADMLGIATNTYSPITNWSSNSSKELEQFKAKAGTTKFKEANNKYNSLYGIWFNQIKNNPRYTALNEEQKSRVITNKKAEIKDTVLLMYGFRYKKEASRPLPKF